MSKGLNHEARSLQGPSPAPERNCVPEAEMGNKPNPADLIPAEVRAPLDPQAALRIALAFRDQMLTLTEIEKNLGVARKKVLALRNRENDPLPTHNLDGTIRVNRGEFQDWKIRQKE